MAASLVPAHVVLTRRLEAQLVARIRADLVVRLSFIEREASRASLALDDRPGWDRLADELGRRAGARVTFVRTDGQVLGDSEVGAEDLAAVERHHDRPEIVAALARGRGSSERLSATRGQRMLYVAASFRRADATAGVARLAVPLDAVDEASSQIDRTILAAWALALLLAVGLSTFAAAWLARGVRQLGTIARRMAAGDLALRSTVGGSDELAELGRALDQLASGLSSTLGELRGERDLLGRVLEAMREGVLLVDRAGRVALLNPALRETLLLPAETRGRPAAEALGNPELLRLLDRAAAGESAADEIEVGDLKPRRLLVTARSLGGEPGGVLAVFVDVTEIRRLETVRRDFVANVSHELRTPVAAVTAATETLRGAMSRDPTAAIEFLDMIERNAQRLHRLLEDLLELSRLESRQFRTTPEDVDLGSMVRQVFGLFDVTAARKWIRLALEIPADAARVRADRRALEQVLTNLVENAVKYCPDGTSVAVRATAQDRMVRLSVADTGPGIDARHLPRLFERFYRVDAGRSRDVGGTGLGLSIVKHLVEAMGGTVDVESTVGRGTTFYFTLPRA